ncbi:hypothetical protein NDU88_002150 [Pleurodeles waltl]|uniref:Myb/SANT-like DNA-binding domain-containing protein n=1 Tax=Pleurodeles waltl TaxID=8319 RepID=A0AAV7SCX5_PLEWA|nr:hypothetical protein NDU88_002150 [Pleurodeles waltl]
MARQRHPRFSEQELMVMVEEIVLVEPQLFGSQVQHTSIARKLELWRRIVDRVNAVVQHPRNREDIRKRWNNLRGKVRSVVSRHHLAVERTRDRPPPPPPQLTTWEEQVLVILHPEGLAGVGGGIDSGPLPNITGQEGPHMSTPPTEKAHSDDSTSVQLDLNDHPGPSGTSGSRFPTPSHRPLQSFPPLETPALHPPSGPIPPSPGHINQQCVHHYREPRLTHHPNNNRDLGAVVVGTRSRDGGPGTQGNWEGCCATGADRPREPTLPEALSANMGAYHHSQETMATVLVKFQETQRLQEEQYMGFREELRTINSTLGTIVGVLKEVLNTRRDTVALQGAPDTSLDDELPTIPASASGQEAPPQDHHTSTPPPAEGEPPRKRSLRSRNKTENDAKTPTKK